MDGSGRKLHLAGFICPLYVSGDTDTLSFTEDSKLIGNGRLKEYPFFERKFIRLLNLVTQIEIVFGDKVGIEFDVVMGDRGVIGANKLKTEGVSLSGVVEENLIAYQEYLSQANFDLNRTEIRFLYASELFASVLPEASEPFSDVVEDGKKLFVPSRVMSTSVSRSGREKIEFEYYNPKVFNQVGNQAVRLIGEGQAMYEPFGFALNYGLAGLAMLQRNVDILIGTDPPGVYLNYMYHAFMPPKDLIVMVPKE